MYHQHPQEQPYPDSCTTHLQNPHEALATRRCHSSEGGLNCCLSVINHKKVALLCRVPARFTLIDEDKLRTRHQYLEQHFNLKQWNELFN